VLEEDAARLEPARGERRERLGEMLRPAVVFERQQRAHSFDVGRIKVE
jgi:hypothetical protein